MRFAVFVDMSRPLSSDEQGEVFAALDALVPNSGCVGPDSSGVHEVYFVVEGESTEAARQAAGGYMAAIMKRSGVAADYTITLQEIR